MKKRINVGLLLIMICNLSVQTQVQTKSVVKVGTKKVNTSKPIKCNVVKENDSTYKISWKPIQNYKDAYWIRYRIANRNYRYLSRINENSIYVNSRRKIEGVPIANACCSNYETLVSTLDIDIYDTIVDSMNARGCILHVTNTSSAIEVVQFVHTRAVSCLMRVLSYRCSEYEDGFLRPNFPVNYTAESMTAYVNDLITAHGEEGFYMVLRNCCVAIRKSGRVDNLVAPTN